MVSAILLKPELASSNEEVLFQWKMNFHLALNKHSYTIPIKFIRFKQFLCPTSFPFRFSDYNTNKIFTLYLTQRDFLSFAKKSDLDIPFKV
jgi:hypothetical protein